MNPLLWFAITHSKGKDSGLDPIEDERLITALLFLFLLVGLFGLCYVCYVAFFR